ncbi:MFS transporter [Glaciecola sp. XM2]|jgi:GPH family glycoside/pentoside/hexuronide:cation symporter|uniref:MFS transporter n=1 Tax=Glaciecola sp. XM2 TaxID=1914931 RepID=UPI001BDE1232|nr:MFS transporter [Glaciecola sp. XM2]MBT1450136.1 MFS transporter [Glaciecola sp. XM2]
MSTHVHQETLPQDKVPISKRIIYGFGAFINNMLGAAIGGMMIVFNLGLGMNPALVGLLSSLPRLTDAITDPLMGYISDNTRTKWGRRRPFIFFGAILAGLIFALIWQLPDGKSEQFYFWYFLAGSMIFYLAYTMFATPWVALGYELTPDYHERTRLMATQNFMGQLAYFVAPWFLWFMQNDQLFDNMIEGAGWLAIIIGAFTICVGVLPAIFLIEPERVPYGLPQTGNEQPKTLSESVKDFFKGFAITVQFKPFLYLAGATFLIFNGFMMIASFQSYVIIYYIFGGDTDLGSQYAGKAGTLAAVATFVAIATVTKVSTLYGKRKAFFFAIGLSIFGYLLKWPTYSPENPMLLLVPVPFIAFGLGGLFTLMGSMVADVCDLDELNTHERREGMFGSIYWWVVKLGMAAALLAGGFLLNATGFDVALGGAQSDYTLLMLRVYDIVVPVICSALAILLVWKYPITEEKAREVRAQLEIAKGTQPKDGE